MLRAPLGVIAMHRAALGLMTSAQAVRNQPSTTVIGATTPCRVTASRLDGACVDSAAGRSAILVLEEPPATSRTAHSTAAQITGRLVTGLGASAVACLEVPPGLQRTTIR